MDTVLRKIEFIAEKDISVIVSVRINNSGNPVTMHGEAIDKAIEKMKEKNLYWSVAYSEIRVTN